jgi:hypothetical protein
MEIQSHDPGDHVIDLFLRKRPIVHQNSDVVTSERRSRVGETDTTINVHVKSRFDRSHTGMCCEPVTHHIPLEARLALQQSVESLAILTSWRAR